MSKTHDDLRISQADYENLLEVSGYRCWICGENESVPGRRLAVDHDHRTGAVRGLLCTRCNRRLGATVDPEWLNRAAEYLEVAARAFGDNCSTCGHAAASELDGDRHLHTCCGKRWRIGYATKGIPASWMISGIPRPPKRAPLRDPATIGHPGKRNCTCPTCGKLPPA